MKTFLKVWASFLLVVAIGCYCIGVFGPAFNRMIGNFFYGTSTEAIVLLITSCGCLLLSISCWIVYGTIRDIEDKIEQIEQKNCNTKTATEDAAEEEQEQEQ